MLGRRGPLSKIVGGTTGFVQEYNADRKARKEAQAGETDDHQVAGPVGDEKMEDYDDEDDDEEAEDDEALAQDLDEAQQAIEPKKAHKDQSIDQIIETFVQQHPPPPYSEQQPGGILSMPVIIPQRRPESHTRGFVRAYAPILADAGIDEQTWLDFLDGFEKAIGKNGWFHAMNAAVWVAGKVRMAVEGFSIIARFVTMAIHLSIEGGRRTYLHGKQNKYLDEMNDQFFKPRGLYCMIIKYKPSSKELDEEVDVTKNITEQVAKRDDEERGKWRNYFTSASGKTQHEEELPEFAPLVFPYLDKMNPSQKESAVKHFGHFIQDYNDRRGQATFDMENPDSKLTGVTPRKEFASRYADPAHPASQGGLVSTVTGGNYNPRGPLGKLQDRRSARRPKLGIMAGRQPGREGRKQRRNARPLRTLLKTDALYLLVVNMPTKEEMDAVLAEVEAAKKASK